MAARYFEDMEIGETDRFGSHEVTEAEIVEFAEKYDPQPFHTDPEAAEESVFGGLVASGWHTASMMMRMIVDGYLEERRSQGALGIDDLRWRRPVRPGDVLSVEAELADKEPDFRAGTGLVRTDTTVLNQDDEAVMTLTSLGMVEKRE